MKQLFLAAIAVLILTSFVSAISYEDCTVYGICEANNIVSSSGSGTTNNYYNGTVTDYLYINLEITGNMSNVFTKDDIHSMMDSNISAVQLWGNTQETGNQTAALNFAVAQINANNTFLSTQIQNNNTFLQTQINNNLTAAKTFSVTQDNANLTTAKTYANSLVSGNLTISFTAGTLAACAVGATNNTLKVNQSGLWFCLNGGGTWSKIA